MLSHSRRQTGEVLQRYKVVLFSTVRCQPYNYLNGSLSEKTRLQNVAMQHDFVRTQNILIKRKIMIWTKKNGCIDYIYFFIFGSLPMFSQERRKTLRTFDLGEVKLREN